MDAEDRAAQIVRDGFDYDADARRALDRTAAQAADRLQPSDIADVVRRLADDMLSAVPLTGGDVSPQAAATAAIVDYRDALIDSLE